MSDDNDKIQEIIRDIAAKHGIAVGRDDPIMILHTINERLMHDTQEAQKVALDGFRSDLELISHRWGEDAKGRAERILNAALHASQEGMASTMNEGARLASEAVRREVAKAVSPISSAASKVERAAWLVAGGGALTFLATLFLFLVRR